MDELLDLFLAKNRRQATRSEEHTSELQSRLHLVCRLLLEKKNNSEHLSPAFTVLNFSDAPRLAKHLAGSFMYRVPQYSINQGVGTSAHAQIAERRAFCGY